MLYPKCPTCGFLLADKEQTYYSELDKIMTDESKTFDEKEVARGKLMTRLGITKMCCRMRVMGDVRLEKLLVPRSGVTG